MCMALAEHLGLSSLTPSEWAGLARERGALPSDRSACPRSAGGPEAAPGATLADLKATEDHDVAARLERSRRRTRRVLGEGSRIIPDTQRLDCGMNLASTRWLSGRPTGLGGAASAKPAPTASGSTSFVVSQISFPGPPACTSIDHLTPWRDKALTPVILNMARAIREEADPLGRARRFRMNP
jgi:hypothetical protein